MASEAADLVGHKAPQEARECKAFLDRIGGADRHLQGDRAPAADLFDNLVFFTNLY